MYRFVGLIGSFRNLTHLSINHTEQVNWSPDYNLNIFSILDCCCSRLVQFEFVTDIELSPRVNEDVVNSTEQEQKTHGAATGAGSFFKFPQLKTFTLNVPTLDSAFMMYMIASINPTTLTNLTLTTGQGDMNQIMNDNVVFAAYLDQVNNTSVHQVEGSVATPD